MYMLFSRIISMQVYGQIVMVLDVVSLPSLSLSLSLSLSISLPLPLFLSLSLTN